MGRSASNGTHPGARRNREEPSSLAEHLRELSAEVAALRETGAEALTDLLAHWLAAHYVAAARRAVEEAGSAGIALATLRGLAADAVALRKGDHSAARLRNEQEWLAIEREKDEARMRVKFEEWLKEPGIKERVCGPGLSHEERNRRMREIFGLPEKQRPGLSAEALSEIERAANLL